jgi:methyl-accepting chemotaxis protein
MVGDAREVTQASQETVDRTVDGMGKVRDLTMRTGQSMKRLSETAQEMNDAMLRVTDMSARLHLIALNAAIEAARAGEQGQGFAVVAQELRSISMTCSEASRKIGDYIRTIQQETTFASEHVEQNIKQVVVQSELVSQTSLSLDATRTITEQVLHLVENANKTTDQQAQGTYHVSNAVNEMLKTSGGMKGLMQETNSSMSQLVELSNALRSRISRLHIGIGDNESPT